MKNVLYPIRAVSKLTGVSLHRLRAWERRYKVVTPVRDDRGRLYTSADVEHLRLLNAAVENGHSIGRLTSLTDYELRELAQPLKPSSTPFMRRPSLQPADSVVAPRSLVDAITRLDHAAAESELGLLAGVLSPRNLIYGVALPLLREVGASWHAGTGSVAQEHLTSSLLRNLLGGMISHHHLRSAPAKILFATPPGEQHEFGILISAMLAAGGGLSIVYLGPNLPADEIVSASLKTKAQVTVLGFVGSEEARRGIGDLEQVAQGLPVNTEIWVGGTKDKLMIEKLNQTRAILIENFESLEQNLIRLGARF